MNSKGQFNFLPYILIGLVIVFVIAIVAIPVTHVFEEAVGELSQDSAFGGSNKSVDSMERVEGLITPAADQVVFISLLAILLGTIIIAVFSGYSAILTGVMIISGILFTVISGLLANAYEDVINNPAISGQASEFTLSNIVLGPQLPIIILITFSIAVIILLSKRSQGGA